MFFAFPLWLLALAPWAGAVLWLLWGRRRRTYVPFLELWRGPALQKPAKRALQPPPIFVGLAIVATLLALLTAAGPQLRTSHGGTEKPLTIIVDCGLTMSARAAGKPRFQLWGENASRDLGSVLSATSTPVDLFLLPGTGAKRITLAGLPDAVNHLTVTAVDTQTILVQTIRDQQKMTDGPIIVISDRRLNFDDARLIQFAPDAPAENVGVVHLAARENPTPQVMVKLRNDSSRKAVELTITSGGQQVRQTLDLPARGAEKDYFVDLAKFDTVIEAALDAADDQPADDKAWLVREGSFPKIEARASLSPELRRMVEVYSRARPPTDSSPVVAIVPSEADLPAEAPAVLVPPSSGGIARGTIVSVAHPVTADVNWSAFPSNVPTAGEPPRGWTSLLTLGGKVIMASRPGAVRQVWVGFDAPAAWSATPDYVIFWANIFTWTGQGSERFASHPLADFEEGWKPAGPENLPVSSSAGLWPGVYHTPAGDLRAFNAPEAAAQTGITTVDWRDRLRQSAVPAQNSLNLAPGLSLLALAGLALAAATWKRRGLTPVSVARTF